MRMADNIAALELLRSGIVRRIGVGEGASDEILDLHSDVEVCVGRDGVAGARIGDDR